MSVIQIIVLSLAFVLIAILAVWSYLQAPLRRFEKQSEKEFLDKVSGFEDILIQLERKETPSSARVEEVAANPRLRGEFYIMLVFHRREDLFPKKYFNWESFAEGKMVEWLSHPHELGCIPDELELMDKVSADDPQLMTTVHYFVYRFRMNRPHPKASGGWLAGIVGPHNLKAEPPGSQSRHTCSVFEPYDSRTPQGHVDHILDLIRADMRR